MNMAVKKEYIAEECVSVLRGTFLLLFGLIVYNRDAVQDMIDATYKSLLTSAFYNSVYFESCFATIVYTIIIIIYPILVSNCSYFDTFKYSPSVTHKEMTIWEMVKETVVYTAPLMLMDTFMVKKYHGVDPAIWGEKQKDWIQYTRALPLEPPTVFQIFYQLVLSLILFDFFFFLVHICLHKNYYLYKYIHKHHHDHDGMHAHVTNQLTVSERVTLVLSANFALKILNSHPLTRTIFILVFLWILVDNHSGYDMPFGFHRLIPFGIAGGSLKHYEHHLSGKRAYQPILNYLDNFLESRSKKQS